MYFLIQNIRFLSFGLTLACLSSFGQTYFIGVYRPAVVDAYGLSNSDFGLLYLIVTIGSAIGLNRLGHIIDRVSLTPYSLGLVGAMAGACVLVSLSGSLWMFLIALLFVRLLGQGMLTHAAMTSMSRYFDAKRGLAVAIAGLGFPLGQAILPATAVALMVVVDWQQTWLVFAGGLLFLAMPCVFWLLRGHRERHTAWQSTQSVLEQGEKAGSIQHLRRRDVIRDIRFYMMLPALMAGPFWITAVFFYAADVATLEGLNLAEYTAFYGFYALGSVAAPFVGGTLVDRFGGRRLMTLYPPLYAVALFIMTSGFGVPGIIASMIFLGLGAGITLPINNSIWPELYGTKFLGEVKSLATSMSVLSTALSPLILGLLLDQNVKLDTIFFAGGVYCIGAAILVYFVSRR
jgi:MFS family permease